MRFCEISQKGVVFFTFSSLRPVVKHAGGNFPKAGIWKLPARLRGVETAGQFESVPGSEASQARTR